MSTKRSKRKSNDDNHKNSVNNQTMKLRKVGKSTSRILSLNETKQSMQSQDGRVRRNINWNDCDARNLVPADISFFENCEEGTSSGDANYNSEEGDDNNIKSDIDDDEGNDDDAGDESENEDQYHDMNEERQAKVLENDANELEKDDDVDDGDEEGDEFEDGIPLNLPPKVISCICLLQIMMNTDVICSINFSHCNHA
jgi:hypothetical protein